MHSSIHKSDIETVHAAIGKNHGQYVAIRTFSQLSIMFNKAIWGGMVQIQLLE